MSTRQLKVHLRNIASRPRTCLSKERRDKCGVPSVVLDIVSAEGWPIRPSSDLKISLLFGSLSKIVFQQADFYACTARTLGPRIVAHPNHVDAVGRNFLV